MDARQVRVENCRQFGGPWLARERIDRLLVRTIERILHRRELHTQNLRPGVVGRGRREGLCKTTACIARWISCCRTRPNWIPSSSKSWASCSIWNTTCWLTMCQHVFRRRRGRQSLGPTPSAAIRTRSAAPARKSASGWWTRVLRCRWATKCLRETLRIRPRWNTSSRQWKPAMATATAFWVMDRLLLNSPARRGSQKAR